MLLTILEMKDWPLVVQIEVTGFKGGTQTLWSNNLQKIECLLKKFDDIFSHFEVISYSERAVNKCIHNLTKTSYSSVNQILIEFLGPQYCLHTVLTLIMPAHESNTMKRGKLYGNTTHSLTHALHQDSSIL